jgi:hypothetical protein
MFVSNPFALLTQLLPPLVMQVYAALMITAVVAGTLLDLHHKRSAEFFAGRREKSRRAAQRPLGGGELTTLALKTLGHEVAASGEFCQWPRRLSHLLTSYGFVVYLITTLLLVFVYATAADTPIMVVALWDLGALMVLVGGLWFFFAQRVDVAHEGRSPWRLMRADLFVGSLSASVAFGLLWHLAQSVDVRAAATQVLFCLYLLFTTLLFVTVPWSKFAHMFYKPMAAFQTRIEEANGASDLPRPATRRSIPE